MKKLLSLIALPLVGIMFLFGCGKVDRTVEEITTLYNTTVSAYASPDAIGENWYFKTLGSQQVLNVTYADSDDIRLETAIAGITKYQQYLDDGLAISDSYPQVSTQLKTRYEKLESVYARTLTMAFNYYANWSSLFYTHIESKNPNSAELTELYDRLKTLQRELESFDAKKKDLEREIRLFGLDSEIIGASIDAFNYSYNGLIDKTLNFVNYFRDLHVKYFFNDVAIDGSYAQRVYDDGVLRLANFIYYDYLVALSKNATVKLDDLTKTNNVYDIFKYTNSRLDTICSVVDVNNSGALVNRTAQVGVNFQQALNDPQNANYETNKSKVQQLEIALNTFQQHFNLYQKVYSKVDKDGFNDYRFGINGNDHTVNDSYLDDLDVVSAANARVLINFEENNVYNFINALADYVIAANN